MGDILLECVVVVVRFLCVLSVNRKLLTFACWTSILFVGYDVVLVVFVLAFFSLVDKWKVQLFEQKHRRPTCSPCMNFFLGGEVGVGVSLLLDEAAWTESRICVNKS